MSAASHRDLGSSIGFGMIGSGGMARIHAEAIRSGATGTRLVAVSGGKRAGPFGSDYDIPAERDNDALLARSDVDAVVIATPHTTHLSLVEAAAAAGKHVFLEKPMGLTVADCDRMIGACRAAGVRLTVAHITRYTEATRVAHELVQGGSIGALRMISVHRILDGYPNAGWPLDPREGSAFLDWGSHGSDIIRWFAGRDPILAFATFATYRHAPPAHLSGMIQFLFPDDVMSQTWMSYEVPADSWIQRARYVFTGSQGLVDLNAYGRVELIRGTDAREVYRQPDLDASSRAGVSLNPYFRDAFGRQIQDFADAIRDGREPSVTGADGRAAIEMVEAAERSAETGQAVRMPLAGPKP
ncbi:MAG: Gfo/Idh/MocA family oxidoreductase [Candidatus Limnocylindrales bacterium]